MRSLFLTLLLFVGLSGICFAQQSLRLDPVSVTNSSLADLTRYRVVSLDLDAWKQSANAVAADETLRFQLTGADTDHLVSLKRYDMRAAAFQPAAGERRLSDQWMGLTDKGGRVRFTIDETFVSGNWVDGETTYHLEPLWRLQPGAAADQYALYRTSDVAVSTTDRCEQVLPEGAPDTPEEKIDHNGAEEKAVGLCFEVEIALAADFEMVQRFGSVSSVENFILGVLADVQTDYDDSFADELVFVVVDTYIAATDAEDPWTNTTVTVGEFNEGLLPDFANWGEAGGFDVDYDVASLWSDRDFDGGTVGVAYVGGLCSNFGGKYNINQNFSTSASSLRVLWSHELGHNFNAQHDGSNGFIMSPSVNFTTTWSSTSIGAVNSFYSSLSCLAACPVTDPPQAALSAPYNELHEGSYVPFFNTSTGGPTSFSWQFPGGIPSSSTDEHPVVFYPSPGNYQATLVASNSVGSSTTQTSVTITDDVAVPQVAKFYNFENGFEDLSVVNPDGANTWGISSTGGLLGGSSAVVDNLTNNRRGQTDALQLTGLDLSGYTAATIELSYAYRRYGINFNDQLLVKASSDGINFITLFIGDQNATGDFATGLDLAAGFVPSTASDWCGTFPACISLDLADFIGEESVTISIENVNGYGNFMYVDDVMLTGTVSSLLPVTWLDFDARATGKVAQLNWSVDQTDDHAGFSVERSSASDASWVDLGWVATQPGTNAVTYDYTDQATRPGETYFYRLRQQDLDGTEAYSDIRSVAFGQVSTAAVFPNPAGNSARLVAPFANGRFRLLNTAGQTLRQGRVTEGAAKLNLTEIPAGIYYVRLSGTAGAQEVIRLVRK